MCEPQHRPELPVGLDAVQKLIWELAKSYHNYKEVVLHVAIKDGRIQVLLEKCVLKDRYYDWRNLRKYLWPF